MGAADVHLWCALCFVTRGRAAAEATDAVLAELVGLSERTVRDSLARLQAGA